MSLVGQRLLGRLRTPCGRRGGKRSQHVTTRCLDEGTGVQRDSVYWWNDQLSVLPRNCLAARRSFTRSKGDPLLRQAWKGHIKSLVYANKPATSDDPKDNIQREIHNVPVEMSARVVENWSNELTAINGLVVVI